MDRIARERQAARNAWVAVVKDAWTRLDADAREHCVSPSNLNRWWRGTYPTDTERELRKGPRP